MTNIYSKVKLALDFNPNHGEKGLFTSGEGGQVRGEAPGAIKPSNLNSLSVAKEDWKTDGYWWKNSVENIPISQINVPPEWNTGKAEKNGELLKSTGKTVPIRGGFNENGKFEIHDGIHRVNAAIKQGYTKIPVVIEKQIFTDPKLEKGIKWQK